MARGLFLNFIIGKPDPALSEADLKRVVLRGNLAIVGLTVGIAYFFIDRISGIHGNEPYYTATVLFSVITIFLNRAGRYQAANILFVSTLNLIVFLFSATDNYRSGVYIFFVVVSLTSFALFDYQDRKLALFFPILSLLLFFYSYWGEHSILAKRPFTEESLRINFTTNFIVAQVTCIAIVYFLINVNFHSEKQILKKNEQLAKANTELDRFVYSASHDLRAPLSSILGLVHVFDLSTSEAEKKQIIGLIRERVSKMDNFISEILDYSRNSRLELRNEKISSRKLIHDIIEGQRYSKNFEKIRMDTSGNDCTIQTDPERIKVVLNNLIANSIKYYDPAKTQPFIRVQFEQTDQCWSAVVEDNGIGIHPDQQSKIFEMFYRAHENSEGSGLGLYIVNEVISRMGGSITVQSELGQGAAFTIRFPETVVAGGRNT